MASQRSAEFARGDVDSVKQLQNVLHEAAKFLDKQVLHEDVVIFIGTTKSGKSTLINYLLDNSLIGMKGKKMLPTCIKKADNSVDSGPQIGGSRKSETAIPSRWENPKRFPDLAMWDTPGFDDNRGKVQDITNAIYIHDLFKHMKSVKIVLVADIQHVMYEPINPFLSLLNSVENLLQEKMSDCFSSIVIVFTKVDESIEIDENFVEELLQPIWTNNSLDMSSSTRDFVRYLTEHNENIGFFKKPSVGPITETIEVGITEAIQRATSIPEDILKDELLPSIVDISKVFLYERRERISSVTKFDNLQRIVCESLQDVFEDVSQIQIETESRDQLHIALEGLTALQSHIDGLIDSDESCCEKLKALGKIYIKIERAIRDDQLDEKCESLEFIDEMLDLKESNPIVFNLQCVIATAKSKVNELMITMNLRLNEIDKKEVDSKIAEMKDKYRKETLELGKELEVIRNDNLERNSSRFCGVYIVMEEGAQVLMHWWDSFKIKCLRK